MNAQMDGLWWTVAILTGAFGSGMLLYGMRQKDVITLVFGLLLNAVPMFVDTGGLAILLTIVVGVLFVLVKKYA